MSSIETRVERVLEAAPPGTTWAVSALEASSGRVLANPDQLADEPFGAASVNKLAIVHALEQSSLLIKNPLVPMRDQVRRPGTGILQYFPNGFEVSVSDLAWLMLTESDNTAACMAVIRAGGAEAVNETLQRSPLDLQTTRLKPVTGNKFEYGDTSAYEAAVLLRQALKTPLFAAALARSHAWYGLRREIDGPKEMSEAKRMKAAKFLGRFHLRGPNNMYERILVAQRDPSLYQSKEGSLENLRHDVAKIGRVVMAAFSRGYDPNLPYGPSHPAHTIHGRLGVVAKSYSDGLII